MKWFKSLIGKISKFIIKLFLFLFFFNKIIIVFEREITDLLDSCEIANLKVNEDNDSEENDSLDNSDHLEESNIRNKKLTNSSN